MLRAVDEGAPGPEDARAVLDHLDDVAAEASGRVAQARRILGLDPVGAPAGPPIAEVNIQAEPTPHIAEPAEAIAPRSDGARSVRPARWGRRVGAAGLALVAFLLLQVPVTSFLHGRARAAREAALIRVVRSGVPAEAGGRRRAGALLGRLSIRRLGVDEVIEDGTGFDQLEGGLGVALGGSLPGAGATSIVVGRRTLFGGPFARIDSLQGGETIELLLPTQTRRYVVTAVVRVDARTLHLLSGPGDRLVLATATPRFGAGLRVAVVATAAPGQPPAGPLSGGPPAPSTGLRSWVFAGEAWQLVWCAIALAGIVVTWFGEALLTLRRPHPWWRVEAWVLTVLFSLSAWWALVHALPVVV